MLADFYNNIILKKPKFVFLSLIILLTFFGFYSKDFRLDASSDTLLIEGDPDQIESYKDQWTFHKSLNDKDPNWELASTKSLG